MEEIKNEETKTSKIENEEINNKEELKNPNDLETNIQEVNHIGTNILHSTRRLPKNSLEYNDFGSIFLKTFTSVILILAVALFIVWHYRANIFDHFAKEYVKQSSISDADSNSLAVFTQQSFVVNAVKKTNPAVVSIIISKNVPKYVLNPHSNTQDQQVNPFGDILPGFPDFFLNTPDTPQYVQKGTQKKDIGGGSGFFVSEDGLIVTNKHVVDQTGVDYTVFTNDGKKHIAKVIAKDPILDIALIKIDGSGYSSIDLGDSDKLQVGQSVIAIGNSLGEFRNTVSVGVVSGLARSVSVQDPSNGKSETLDKVIQTDAAINPGNSGGPLLDLSGKVIGVNVALAEGSQNIGFALPINSVRGAIESVETTGKIIRPFLGVRYINITPDIKETNNLTVDYGALVKGDSNTNQLAVIPGSPADKAGIVENDIILEVDGVKLNDKVSLTSIIGEKKVGDVVNMKILHRGVEKNVKLTLEAAPQDIK